MARPKKASTAAAATEVAAVSSEESSILETLAPYTRTRGL